MELSVITGLFSSLKGHVSNFLKQIIQEQAVCYFLYESNVEKLEQSIEHLREIKERVQHQVDNESRYGKEIAIDVLKWLKQVDDIIAEKDEFWKDKDLPYTVCSKGFLPKHGMRYRLGKTAYKLSRQVENVCKTSFPDGVSSGPRPISIDFILSDLDFESFNSRKAVAENIMHMLKDSTDRMIGIYGSGGVGKTTLVKKVASQAQRDKLFEVVLYADVTRNPDIKKIQGQLSDQLGARLGDESEIGRASRLRDIFKKEKRSTLVVLDDLWAGLDLNKLGIPVDDVNLSPNSAKYVFKNKMSKEVTGVDDYKKEVTGDFKMFKILLTSRSREVLFDKMDVKENSCFSVECLQDKEAEIFFKKVAKVADKTVEFGPLATKFSKKCDGLPLALVAIARTLRNKNDYSEWNAMLGQLERREFTGVAEPVVLSIKLSFEHLENEELKSTFLLCAQLGHHPLIMDLVKYCIGLGIFEGIHTIGEIRERILTLIEKLKDSSLLLSSYSIDRFNMHDMIRDVTLSIASKEHHLFTMRNGKLDEWPHINEFQRYSVISIHNCDINDELPECVSCPRLKVFHVDDFHPSFKIPNNFFGEMEELRALILTGIDLSLLPTSIRCLKDLRMLCLEQCLLGDISFIGELQKLIILSLAGSKFENLPIELGQLHKLQLFDISNCSELKEIPPNVLSRLKKMEELYMRNSVKWESEGNQGENAILAELRLLHQLKNLDICIPSATVLPRNLFLSKLDSYKIVIGDFEILSVGAFKMPDKNEASRVLALQIKENNLIRSQKGITMLFRRVEIFLLGELNGVRVFHKLNLEGFPCLKQLSIVNNSDIECIINVVELPDPKNAFPNLELLFLYKLNNMKKISYGKPIGTSFSNLKVIRIEICAQLKHIFSLSMVKFLSSLETIDVSNCDSMENIVAKEEHDANEKVDDMFPKLRSLALEALPKFFGVYSNDQDGSADICLFNEQVAIPNLESLELSSINMRMIWNNRSKPFKNLIELTVENCHEIEYLLSFSMVRSLENLKSMCISGCKKMVEIFKYEEIIAQEARNVPVFPKLEEIHLPHMDNLTSIWPIEVSPNSFPSLNSVFIEWCHTIAMVLPSHMVGRYDRLESLKIADCDQMKVIFDLEGAPQFCDSAAETHLRVLQIQNLPELECIWNGEHTGILNFEALRSIKVSECENLGYLFPVSIAKGLQKLDSLSVFNCARMEEIAHGAAEEGLNERGITFEFLEVTVVAMDSLPELKSFYRGRHSLKWPKLKRISVTCCDKLAAFKTETTNLGGPIFLPEEIIAKLEFMAISLKEADKLKHHITNFCMNRLNDFALISCSSVEILYLFLDRMPYLERLSLFDCNFRELIPSGSLVTQESIGTVVQLKYLSLYFLKDLENIGFESDPVLQCLEHLSVEHCHKLISLAPSSVTFPHLTSLKVHECEGIKNLMGFSTAKSLDQLLSLKVIGCTRLEKIVAEQNDEVGITSYQDIIFSKLLTLELDSLPILSCFSSSEIHDFKFPSLEKLIVRGCPRMTKFSKRVTIAPNLQVFFEGEEEGENWYWKRDLNATILKVFRHSVQSLELSEYVELEEIWSGKTHLPADKSFQNLRTLVVENCEFISYVIPSHLLPYLENLEVLDVRRCMSVVAIFDVNNKVMVKSHLKTLILDQLPNMKRVWNKNPCGYLSFENLESVAVNNCECLQTLFPAATLAKNLLKLENLQIVNCGALVEIVGKAETSEQGAIEQFEFPHLTRVRINMVPQLKYFYPGRMLLRCPELKLLDVYHCGKLQIFTSKSLSYQGAAAERQVGPSIHSQPIFSIQEVISHLEEISLNEEETMMLCDEDIPPHLVSKVAVLQLYCFHFTEAGELPFEILHKFPNMRTLAVACCSFYVIFPQRHGHKFTQLGLTGLRLDLLPFLASIGLEHSSLHSLRESFKFLIVERCRCLTELVHSPVSFSNLEEIIINECHGLVYLFTTPTARSLLQLKQLVVYHCGSIQEIVAQEEDKTGRAYDEIIFGKLQEVNLGLLPSIACFYTGSSTLKFPNLENLQITQCPKMKFFSQQRTYAPFLPDIPPSVNMENWRWEVDCGNIAAVAE